MSALISGRILKMAKPAREIAKKQEMRKRFEYESTHIGGLEVLFPSGDPDLHAKYDAMLRHVTDLFEEHISDSRRAQMIMRELKLSVPSGTLSIENLRSGSTPKKKKSPGSLQFDF